MGTVGMVFGCVSSSEEEEVVVGFVSVFVPAPGDATSCPETTGGKTPTCILFSTTPFPYFPTLAAPVHTSRRCTKQLNPSFHSISLSSLFFRFRLRLWALDCMAALTLSGESNLYGPVAASVSDSEVGEDVVA